jgi:serine/threonine-protein kinase
MSDPVARLNTALDGRYRIERKLGEGGMATVYLAEDLRHERRVALKVLKPELAAVVGAERFLAEIKTTANLQHPHILALFDSGEADGFLFYVMPYVEGETLQDRIEREKQLPVNEAVRIASAVANALDHAHRHGVVHRDIKPANILIQDNEPVVADFGIALAVGAAGGSRLTETGLSLGTPYYMSPEQATGDQIIGPASDTYALACVLYELLTGDPPYVGSTAQAVLGKIIAGAATAATELRPSIPANVDAALRRALEKLPADRFTTAQEFAKALADPAFRYGERTAAEVAAVGGPWKTLALAFGAVAAVLAVALGSSLMRSDPPAGVLRYALPVPAGLGGGAPFGPNIAISRDGTKLVSADIRDGTAQIWLRERDQLTPRIVSGTEGARQPFFSPDGQRIAFITTEREIKVVSLGGEPPLTLVDSGLVRGGGSWADDGYLYFTRGEVMGGLGVTLGLGRVPEVGGPVEAVSELDSARAEVAHLFPDALPNGRGVVFTISRERLYDATTTEIGVVDLATGAHRVLLQGVMARWVSTGHLLVVRQDGALLAAPFDDDALEVTGPAVPLLEGLDIEVQGTADLVISDNGTLAYVAGSSQTNANELVWVSRSGGTQEIDPDWSGAFFFPRLSPDGSRLAVAITDPTGTQVWIKQLDQGPLSKLTFEGTVTGRANWHPDGQSLVFRSIRGENSDLYSRRADGGAPTELIMDDEVDLSEVLYSPDGDWLVYRRGGDLFAQRVGSDDEAVALASGDSWEGQPSISPDGRWIAFVSGESGTPEVFVHPFPNTGDARWQISTDGGSEPVWAHSGRELFYRSLDQQLISVDVLEGGTFIPGDRRALFSMQQFASSASSAFYDVAPGDERFVMVRIGTGDDAGQIVFVENFVEELRQRLTN